MRIRGQRRNHSQNPSRNRLTNNQITTSSRPCAAFALAQAPKSSSTQGCCTPASLSPSLRFVVLVGLVLRLVGQQRLFGNRYVIVSVTPTSSTDTSLLLDMGYPSFFVSSSVSPAISPRSRSSTPAFLAASATYASSAATFSSRSATAFSQSVPLICDWSCAAYCRPRSSRAYASSCVLSPWLSPAMSATFRIVTDKELGPLTCYKAKGRRKLV